MNSRYEEVLRHGIGSSGQIFTPCNVSMTEAEGRKKLPVCPHIDRLVQIAEALNLTRPEILAIEKYCGNWRPFIEQPGRPTVKVENSPIARDCFCNRLGQVLAKALEEAKASTISDQKEKYWITVSDDMVTLQARSIINLPDVPELIRALEGQLSGKIRWEIWRRMYQNEAGGAEDMFVASWIQSMIDEATRFFETCPARPEGL